MKEKIEDDCPDHYKKQIPCEHMWALYKIIAKNPATQDYICINCKEIKRGLRS